ncbi:MAG TPA: hypothetical protein VGR91_09100 [Stellaceae bacterium]|nr:hypothetical protein [Stellaceae bacterium]
MSRFQQIFRLYGSGTNASTKAAGDFPTATYCILITPRSGSTWLTREMARRDVLSTPDEYFNLEELPNGSKNNPACSLPDYFAVISNNLTFSNSRRKLRCLNLWLGINISYTYRAMI